MNPSTEILKIQKKLVDSLDSGWRNKLKSFILTQEFESIIAQLVDLKNENIRFTPPVKDLFRSFSECPYDKLKLVIVGESPYNHFTLDDKIIADGIAFSHKFITEDFMKEENKRLREAVGDTSNQTDLTRWANQGILLLNSSLTTTVGSIKGHYKIWHPFTGFIMDALNNHEPLVFLFMGERAASYADLIDDDKHHKIITTYPDYKWKPDGIFEEINSNLKSPIQWQPSNKKD